MVNFKKVMSLLVALSLTAAIAGGCGSKPAEEGQKTETTQAATTAAEKKDEKIVLKVFNWHTERVDVYNKIFADFKKQNPNIDVVYESKDDKQYYSLLTTAIQSGDAPDLYATHGIKTSNLKQFVDIEAALPLDDVIDFSSYPQTLMIWGQIDGKTYMTPSVFYDTFAVFYNKDIFEKYSLQEPKTPEDLAAICETLSKNGVTPFSLPGKDAITTLWYFLNSIIGSAPDWNNQFPSKTADFNSPEFLQALKAMEDFRDKGYFGKEYQAMDANGAYLYFSSGKAAMMADGSWQAKTYENMKDIKVSTFHWPTAKGQTAMLAAPATDLGYSVYGKTKYKDESIELVKYLMSTEANQEIANMGNNIPALNIPSVKGLSSPVAIIQKMAQADLYVNGFNDVMQRHAKEGYDVYQVLTEALQKMLYKQAKAEDVVKACQEFLDPAKLK